MILEAMKMQNEILAPLSGEVIEINCQSGDSIEANMPLVVIQPHKEDNDQRSSINVYLPGRV